MTLFAFVDIETTGLDPLHDHVLEVAWLITNADLQPVSDARTFLVEHGDEWGDVFAKIREEPKVAAMHSESGLMQDLFAKPAIPMLDIADAFRADLYNSLSTNEEAAHLAGFSVHFDRDFLANRWPSGIIKSMHHRLFDLSAMKLMALSAGIPYPDIHNPRPHRALSDVQESLAFAQSVQFALRKVFN